MKKSGRSMNMNRFIALNFFSIIVLMFLFVALGQWNHAGFEAKAYMSGKELILAQLSSAGEKSVDFIEPPEFSIDVIRALVVTEEGTRYAFEVGVMNPLLVQLTALNLFVQPKVEILAFQKFQSGADVGKRAGQE